MGYGVWGADSPQGFQKDRRQCVHQAGSIEQRIAAAPLACVQAAGIRQSLKSEI